MDLISVIIPSYNRKEFIANAVNSVLNQTYKNIEIIIIDDGSTDGTEQFIRQNYNGNTLVSFICNETNMGAGTSRKIGYTNSRGNYIIFMDDDDYYTNNMFFEYAIDIFKNNKDISFVSSNSIIEYMAEQRQEESIMNIHGKVENIKYLENFQTNYMKSNSTFTTIFKKDKLKEAKFDEVNMVNDSTIYLRALLSGNAYILDEISGIYRIHSKNISFNLNIDFIIENLIEKKKIYEIIKQQQLLKNPEKWIIEQTLLTVKYVIEYSHKKEDELKKLIVWCENNISGIHEEIEKIYGRNLI